MWFHREHYEDQGAQCSFLTRDQLDLVILEQVAHIRCEQEVGSRSSKTPHLDSNPRWMIITLAAGSAEKE